MKLLRLINAFLFIVSSVLYVGANAAPIDTVKVFSGKLLSGQSCKVTYGPAIRIDNSTWRINGLLFELGTSKVELSGAKLVTSELNLQTNILSGHGVLDRKVVISSDVLGVGYETGILVDFRVKIDAQANPLEYYISTQSYRNEFVFGSWAEGERGKLETYVCGKQ